MSPEISRRSVATGAAWAVPTVTVLAAAPSMAASGSASAALTGVTGYYPATTVTNGGSDCTSYNGGAVTPSTSSTNPAPYIYASTGVAIGSATGTQVSMTIDLVNTADSQNSGLDQKVTFIPGTYSYVNESGNSVTATSTCATTNSSGACTAITITWALSGTGTTADNPQNVPFRVGMVSGTTIPSSDSVTTGFDAPVFGSGGPSNVQSTSTMAFNGGTYSGSPSCPTP